jgi:hypothetical protein
MAVVLASCCDSESIQREIDHLLRLAAVLPSGEVVLAAAVVRAAQRSSILLGEVIPKLLAQEPTTSRLKEGALVDLLVTDHRIRLHFGEGMDEEVVGNTMPWLVLSHLASWPMAIEGSIVTENYQIFATVGDARQILFQPRPSELAQVPCLHTHEIEGLGTFPCLRTGIVEPLLQAMVQHAHRFPDELVALAHFAREEKKTHLAWRLLTTAITTETCNDNKVRKAARTVKDVLQTWWHDCL